MGGWALATYLKNRVYDSSTRTPDTMKCGMIILLTTKDRPFAAQAFCILLSWHLSLEMVGGGKGFGLRMSGLLRDKLSDDSNVKEGDGKLSHHKLGNFINFSEYLGLVETRKRFGVQVDPKK